MKQIKLLFFRTLAFLLRKFIKYTPFLSNTYLKESLFLCQRYVYLYSNSNDSYPQDKLGYFKANQDKIDLITNLLADSESKLVYLKRIKFLQTNKLKDHPPLCCKHQEYFPEMIKFEKDDVILDCGLGPLKDDTIERFIAHCPDYQQIIGFEPLVKFYELYAEKYKHNPKITLYKAGVFNEQGQQHYIDSESGSHIIDENNDSKDELTINTMTIDSLDLEKVSLIKMDIEGAELNALKGAEKTILKYKPKLAICLYHNIEDMVTIPLFIHNLNRNYKFYIRQYCFIYDTILYAIP